MTDHNDNASLVKESSVGLREVVQPRRYFTGRVKLKPIQCIHLHPEEPVLCVCVCVCVCEGGGGGGGESGWVGVIVYLNINVDS